MTIAEGKRQYAQTKSKRTNEQTNDEHEERKKLWRRKQGKGIKDGAKPREREREVEHKANKRHLLFPNSNRC